MQPYYLAPALGADAASGWLKLGVENHMAGKMHDAERCYRTAVGLAPNNAAATCNLAILLSADDPKVPGQPPWRTQPVEADLAMDRAALFAPKDPLILANRAMMKLQYEDIEAGVESAERALALTQDKPAANDPLAVAGYLLARLAYAMLAATSGHPDKALPVYREMLAVDPKHGAAGPNSCFITSLMDVGPEVLREVRDEWYTHNRYAGAVWPHGNSKDPDRPLRVGYVGGDFKSHSAAMMFSQVILNHSAAVVPYFYSTLPTNPEADDLTQRFMHAAGAIVDNPDDGPPIRVADGHRWREVHGLTDEAIDDLIRRDNIDILVDLAGHTNGGRLALFTRKPAPVQVTAWGFAHSVGAPEIDYFFADPVAVPPAERHLFVEKIADLPSIVTYRPPDEYGLKGSSPLPYYVNDHITLGSFSRFEKLSDGCLATFAEIVRRVPDSKMLFKDHAMRRPYSLRRILKAFEGIDPERIQFGQSTPHHEHLGFYQRADLYLDTYAHGAGVVTLECLYMGVPLVTRYGPQAAGRTAASVLTALGRTDWITYSADEFVEKAVALAGQPEVLAKARKTLRQELVSSPVVKNYHLAVEEKYREMWREYCAKG